MRIKTIIAAAMLLSAVPSVRAQSRQVSEIEIQKGEKWWGLTVDNSRFRTPFTESFTFNALQISPMRFAANMMLSDRGRYIWSAEPMSVKFDGTRFTITTRSASVSVESAGKSLREAYLLCCHKNFPPQPINVAEMLFRSPIYELGGENELLFTQTEVEHFADRIIAAGAPKGTILSPQGWLSLTGSPVFDAETYPNPKGMVDALHKKGMKVMLTITPYVMASGRSFQQNRLNGTLINDASGKPIVFESRLGYTACTNLTDEEAKAMNAALKNIQRLYGIDGFYFDCLDAMPLLRNSTARMQSFLAAWNTVSDGIDAAIYSSPNNVQLSNIVSAVSPSRAVTWKNLSESLETAVDASVLGYSRTCLAADMTFSQPGENLILRTAQLAALMPVAIIPYEAWNLTDLTQLKEILSWRDKAGDYILALARTSGITAEPIIRHIEYHFPKSGFANCRDEFMIGSKYLVAPVISSGNTRMVRLPKGRWKDLRGRVYQGPRVIDADVSGGKTAIYELLSLKK